MSAASGISPRQLRYPLRVSLRWLWSSMSPPSFPPTVPCPGAPFPPRGPSGRFPRFFGTAALRLPAAPPASLRFLRRAVPPLHAWASLPRSTGARSAGLGLAHRGARPATSTETTGSPRFLGNPLCTRALLSDPGGTSRARPLPRFGVAFRQLERRRLPRRNADFGAQSHGPRARCLRFAGRVTPRPRKTRFRLVASLCRAGLVTRWVPSRRFQLIPSSSPRLRLAHPIYSIEVGHFRVSKSI